MEKSQKCEWGKHSLHLRVSVSTVQECWNKAKNNNYYVLYPLLTLPYLTYVRLCKVVFLVKKLIFRGWGVVAKYH